jgi:hypothetical protein
MDCGVKLGHIMVFTIFGDRRLWCKILPWHRRYRRHVFRGIISRGILGVGILSFKFEEFLTFKLGA